MKACGECTPYRYPQEVLGHITNLMHAAKKSADTEMEVVVAANTNLSTDGMTYLALRCQRVGVSLLENPMALRHLPEQAEARKEFSQPLGFGGDYHTTEDFAQGIKKQVGMVLTPDAGRIGGVRCLPTNGGFGTASKIESGSCGAGGPLSLLTVARSLSGRKRGVMGHLTLPRGMAEGGWSSQTPLADGKGVVGIGVV